VTDARKTSASAPESAMPSARRRCRGLAYNGPRDRRAITPPIARRAWITPHIERCRVATIRNDCRCSVSHWASSPGKATHRTAFDIRAGRETRRLGPSRRAHPGYRRLGTYCRRVHRRRSLSRASIAATASQRRHGMPGRHCKCVTGLALPRRDSRTVRSGRNRRPPPPAKVQGHCEIGAAFVAPL
jgi:hypothetical protein